MSLTKIEYEPNDVLGADQVNAIQDAIIENENNLNLLKQQVPTEVSASLV